MRKRRAISPRRAHPPHTSTLAFYANMRYRLTQLKWQLPLIALVTALLALCLWKGSLTRADITALDRATFITSLAAVASILALFCSISIAFVLFVSQSNKAERVAAYDMLKARLLETQRWLLSQQRTDDRELCLSLIFELDKHDMSDLPQTDLGDEYRNYGIALDAGLDSASEERREFYLTSVMYFGYIEHLLSRIGLVAIKQIIAKTFIDTLAKGVGVICIAVSTLLVGAVWYSDAIKPVLVVVSTFCGVASMFLFYEFCLDLYRYYDDELDFIERSRNETEG